MSEITGKCAIRATDKEKKRNGAPEQNWPATPSVGHFGGNDWVFEAAQCR